MKIIILDEFKEELSASKAMSLIYEGGLDEFKGELGKSDEEGSLMLKAYPMSSRRTRRVGSKSRSNL